AAREVDVAVVEAGLGGRYDATNVLGAHVVVLTNVALDHTDVLGDTREAIAGEKLAVVGDGAVVVLGDPEWEGLARAGGAARVELPGASNLGLAVAAAEAHLGRPVDPHAADGVAPAGRPAGRGCGRGGGGGRVGGGRPPHPGRAAALPPPPRPPRRYVVAASILADKAAEPMLRALTALGDTLVATSSANPRALPAEALAALA